MIHFQRTQLDNGLKVLVHEDDSTPMAVVNLLYQVGAKNESPDKTGFAHLFEHLMFGGSKNAPVFDEPLQWAGGESNAFTNNDITNYYEILPASNIETAFWLESDRMMNLIFSEQSLDVQRKVVVEEFKENYLNQPYGDAWHRLSKLCYEVHPYRWPTIGLSPKHVEQSSLEDVKNFFYNYYRPNNAVLTVTGNVKADDIFKLAQEWFGEIPAGEIPKPTILPEPIQQQKHLEQVEADVPLDALFMAFHMPDRLARDYYVCDLLTDILSHGRSSRLYRRLMKEQRLFSDIDAYITGSVDPGLLVVEGKPADGVSLEDCEAAIWRELNQLKTALVEERELNKIKNKMESHLVFSEVSILNKAMNLSFFEMLGDANLINKEVDIYQSIEPEDLLRVANDIFTESNCSEVIYKAS